MKRARYIAEVEKREVALLHWVQLVRFRRGEAPYELLREWRATFGIPSSAPYLLTYIVFKPGGLVMCCARTHDILMYTDGTHVIMCSKDGFLTYNFAEARWPWVTERRQNPFRILLRVPRDVWQHYIVPRLSNHQLVRLASIPLCRAWRDLWNRQLSVLWDAMVERAPSYLITWKRGLSSLVRLQKLLVMTRHFFGHEHPKPVFRAIFTKATGIVVEPSACKRTQLETSVYYDEYNQLLYKAGADSSLFICIRGVNNDLLLTNGRALFNFLLQ